MARATAQKASLKRELRRVEVLDDLANRKHYCDLLVDPGYGRRAEPTGRTPPHATLLTGPAYAPLVRPEFASARRRGDEPPRQARTGGAPSSRWG